MPLAGLTNIVHEFPKLTLLKGASLEIAPGERVALVGANGTGKTTLFRILARQLAPTQGQVFWSKGLRIGYLEQQQEISADGLTVRSAARRAFADLEEMEHRLRELSTQMASAAGPQLGQLMAEYSRLEARHTAAGGYAWEHQVEEVLEGVGFSMDSREQPVSTLSGGQQCRLALAQVLLGGADLLLLDEPTNHLDLEAVGWLEKFLLHLPAAVLIISHDRYMLDRVASKVLELRDGKIETYAGNYTNYVRERQIRQLHRQRQFEKDQAYIAKERDFIARFHASGSRSREAKGRWTRLERQLAAGEFLTQAPQDDQRLALRISAASRGSELAVRLEEVRKSYGDKCVVNDVTLDLTWQQKLAILGPNGVGKTTLLRLVLGEIMPDSGTVKVGKGMTIGYYDQRQTGLDETKTVLEQMVSFTNCIDEPLLRKFLARFLFAGDEVFKPVSALSGGERSRLLLARLLFSRPNFLVLDEPTNHLDIPSREVLEDALCEYDGTVLLVSHDRYFVDRVCDRMLMLNLDSWELVAGNYTFWRQREEERQAEAAAQKVAAVAENSSNPRAATGAKAGGKQSGKGAKKGNGAEAAAKPSVKVGGLNTYYLDRLTVAEVEQKIHQAETKLAEIEASFADPKVYAEAGRWQQVQDEHAEVRRQIEALMEVWQYKMERESEG